MALDEVSCHEMRLEGDEDAKSTTTDYRTLLNDSSLREDERLSSTVIRWSRRHGARKGSGDNSVVLSFGFLGSFFTRPLSRRTLLLQSNGKGGSMI